VRRARDRETSAATAFQQDVQVLSWLKTQCFDRGQAQPYLHDIGCERCEARNSTGQSFDLDVADARDEPSLDYQIAEGSRLTKKDVAGLLFGRGDSQGTPVRVADLAGPQPCTARAAVTRLATMGEVQASGESRVEHRLSGADTDRPPVRLDPNRVVF
jgi:hypothetical protein